MRGRGKSRSSWDAHRHGNCGWDARGRAPQNREVAPSSPCTAAQHPALAKASIFRSCSFTGTETRGLGTGEARGRGWGVWCCDNPADFPLRGWKRCRWWEQNWEHPHQEATGMPQPKQPPLASPAIRGRGRQQQGDPMGEEKRHKNGHRLGHPGVVRSLLRALAPVPGFAPGPGSLV